MLVMTKRIDKAKTTMRLLLVLGRKDSVLSGGNNRKKGFKAWKTDKIERFAQILLGQDWHRPQEHHLHRFRS